MTGHETVDIYSLCNIGSKGNLEVIPALLFKHFGNNQFKKHHDRYILAVPQQKKASG